MQIKVITIPIIGGEAQNEELNLFLRSKKVLQVEQQLVSQPSGAVWSFCIKYLEGAAAPYEKPKVDYKQVLGEEEFQRFLVLKTIRKKLAQEEAVPAYAVFTDEELSHLARLSEISLAEMKKIKGIGEKKTEKYGEAFVSAMTKP